MKIEAHAKINLTLKVLGVRADGYHDLESVVMPVPLHDDIELTPADKIVVEMPGDIPQEKNLAWKAADVLRRAAGCGKGARIKIVKRIPAGAGLGGGSSDAAAVLNGLNELWGLNLSKARLCELAAEVGSDVPALTLGGPVLMEGRGERVTPLQESQLSDFPLPDMSRLVLRTPPVFVSTPAVFREFREDDCGKGTNDLQPAACRLHPEIVQAVEELKSEGCEGVMMSGSGSSVFGFYRKEKKMMNKLTRRNFLACSTGATLAWCGGVRAADKDQIVRAELRRQIDTKLIYGGVCGIVGGSLYVDGLQWFRKQQKPMVADSIFDLASVGKTFTSFLCAKLVGEGKMDPDAPFTKYLPQHVLAHEDCKITVRDLAMHIGGFDNSKPYIVWNDPKEFDRRLFLKRPVRERGVKHVYACSNFIYLGRIVENLTGMDLEAAAKKFIWDPLGMKDTTWSNIPNHPRAVETFANGNVPIGMRGDDQARAYPRGQGNGAAFSTAGDMLRFVDAILNRRLLTKEAYDLLYTCRYEKGEDRYSFGWDMELARVPPGWSKHTIYHGGFTGNTIAIDPENGFAGVVLTNRRGDRMAGYLGHARLLSMMTGKTEA